MGLKTEIELGSRIALIRKQKHLNQQQLADLCNVSQRTISLFENGKSGNVSTLIKILRALEHDIQLKSIVSEIKLTEFLE
jgi:transcriptional regulator with XRE-family HTH domain